LLFFFERDQEGNLRQCWARWRCDHASQGWKTINDPRGPSETLDHFDQSLEIARKIEYCRIEGDALLNLSLVLEKLGQRPGAIDHAKAELAIFEQIESPDAEKARRKLADWQGSDHRIKPENMRKKVGPVEGMRRLPDYFLMIVSILYRSYS
jgi:hypothetical protein